MIPAEAAREMLTLTVKNTSLSGNEFAQTVGRKALFGASFP
jgi:hypothetical protein